MNSLSCIIIEDEILAKKSLENLCGKNDLLQVKSSFNNGTDALNFLNENPVDLIFLDIEMPDMNGWELLDKLSYNPFVIVISANKKYAFDAFHYNVVDFIIKPISQIKLDASLLKGMAQFENRRLLRNNNQIYIKSNGKLVNLEFHTIRYLESFSNYIKIFVKDESYIVYCSLKIIENKLPSKLFYKIHRSYIVNLTKIQFIEDNDVCINGKLIPIARSQKTDFLHRLNIL